MLIFAQTHNLGFLSLNPLSPSLSQLSIGLGTTIQTVMCVIT